MAASLIWLFCLSVKYLNFSHRNHLIFILALSLVFSNIQIIYFNNLQWIFADGTCPVDLKLSLFGKLRLAFHRENNKKNIFYGVWNHTKVVLKEYPSNGDCFGLDAAGCQMKYLKHVNSSSSEEIKSLVVCPTVQGFQQEVETLLSSNFSFESMTEPLILQMLPPDWPIPNSFGIRGKVMIQEYVGPTMSSFGFIPWKTRAKIAKNLLKMARIFTFGHEQFSFYFTDMSPDNLAIRDNFDVVLIDLDHVIVVDRHAFGATNSQHVTEGDEDVFSFSTQDICNHSVSDLNYYSICQHIFRHSEILGKNWLLSEIPQEVDDNYPELRSLLEECAAPVQTNDRISAGQSLEQLLASIVNHAPTR